MRSVIEGKDVFASRLANASEHDFLVYQYVHHIGVTFVQIGRVEDAIISEMVFCNKIKLKEALRDDLTYWERIAAKQQPLENSTFGSLINIMAKHDFRPEDIAYLKWIKSKRDFFIHRFFNDGRWPGKVGPSVCEPLCRQLVYLQIIFDRAAHRVWRIFATNSLLSRVDLGDAGALMFNPGEPQAFMTRGD